MCTPFTFETPFNGWRTFDVHTLDAHPRIVAPQLVGVDWTVVLENIDVVYENPSCVCSFYPFRPIPGATVEIVPEPNTLGLRIAAALLFAVLAVPGQAGSSRPLFRRNAPRR